MLDQPTPYLLSDQDQNFPHANHALDDPNGLLAIGGDLKPSRLLNAYRHGIFPWYEQGQPILWWSPDPRAVLYLDDLKISRSLQKTLNKNLFAVSYDTCFKEVMLNCAKPRAGSNGTWITTKMLEAYCSLHQQGIGHSIEVWCDQTLVGGLYGLSIGRLFCGESMFSNVSNASKVALVKLVELLKSWDYVLIDCQVPNPHLLSLGVKTIPRYEFLTLLQKACNQQPNSNAWQKNNISRG